ncbi:MAG: Rab family GTPase, partial [Promethearchaeota archaeon]
MQDDKFNSQNEKILKFVCPVCKAEKKLRISKSMISQDKTLTTVSIQKNEICEHHFQAFIDKDFKIRGYQKVDFEIETKKRLPRGEYIMKVIIIGDYEVGKTAITRRYIDNTFDFGYIPTVQLKISTKKLDFEDTHVKLVIWDVGGQVTYMSPYRKDFYEGAQSAIIVVDRTRPKTLENAEKWYKDSSRAVSKKIPYILVGNKSDLVEEIVIDEQDLQLEAEKLDMHYFITSAKTGQNVNDLFTNLTYLFLD